LKRKYLFLILLGVLLIQLRAQRFDDDAAIWTNVYLEKKLSKKLRIHLNQQNRFNNNVTQYGLGYADVGITYIVNKRIKILTDYVFAKRIRLDRSYSNRHQFYVALVLKHTFNRFALSYRNMFQLGGHDLYTSYEGRVPVFYERNKLTLKYELTKRYTFYVAEEIYWPLYQARNKTFNRSRSFAGLFYSFSKKSQLEIYFAYQQQLNAFDAAKRIFIYGIGYSHQL
jgi:hypothetical protein